MDEYVYLIPLPGRIRETVSYNADGSHTILIREDLSREEQLKAYEHARRHIISNDFEKDNVQEIEKDAHSSISQNCDGGNADEIAITSGKEEHGKEAL